MQVFIKLSKLILLAAVLAGCSKTDGEDRSVYKYDNYVDNYIKPEKLFSLFAPIDGATANEARDYDNLEITLRFYPVGDETYSDGTRYSGEQVRQFWQDHFICRSLKSTDDVIYDQPYNPEFNRIYDSLCVAHKDAGLKKTDYIGQFSYPVVFRRITLDMVSDAAYDAAHPAGTSLADILDVQFHSAKEFIESGYVAPQAGTPESKGWCLGDGTTLTMPLYQFNNEYRKLVGGSFRFEFTKAPDATSTHRFTIVYRDEDGRVLTSQMEPVTIQGGK